MASGAFTFRDALSTISMANSQLLLKDLMPSSWNAGTITGTNSSVSVLGFNLDIEGAPGGLGTNLFVGQSAPQKPGRVTLSDMLSNLTLTGADNTVAVQNGGTLALNQTIPVNGLQNVEGGIDFAQAHTGKVAISVESGGLLSRVSTPVQGVSDQVLVAGAIYDGGTVLISRGNLLNITGKDANNYSYVQQNSATATLEVDAGGNITASGTYQINTGTVQLEALSGQRMTIDALDGAGLNFANDNNTLLKITDSTDRQPGWVGVGGAVTLAANTTLTMNYSGGLNNTPDVLYVQNGALNLNGTLVLNSVDTPVQKPTAPLDFLGDSGGAASIVGAFVSLRGNVPGATYTGEPDTLHPGYYQVTIQ